MPNSLVRYVSFNAGPWLVGTLVKHYFDQRFKDEESKANTANGRCGDLRRDELLYDEAFFIIKSFLEASSNHTVEELQELSNVRTPSPPWIRVVRILVPMSCCDEAAAILIDVLGGTDKTREIVGGTKWWQVRGIQGVDSQWIVARKDYQEAEKRRKMYDAERQRNEDQGLEEQGNLYSTDMDDLRCILYLHGGGFYFGSVDQERYFMQRFARKSGCRLFGINYRLAPQYPFPCALQDALAAYLYLIRPPLGSLHTPVNPAHIIIAGDSAGGNLSLTLLQVLRDASLPAPAGGVLISPWCDLTHSFPSVHLNTDTDIIPKYGLSLFKPSPLWPPPPEGMTQRVHTSLRTRIKQKARRRSQMLLGEMEDVSHPRKPISWKGRFSLDSNMKHKFGSFQRRILSRKRTHSDHVVGDVRTRALNASRVSLGISDHLSTVDVGQTAPMPTAVTTNDQVLSIVTEKGEKLEVPEQVHLYAVNTLLTHPLVSPALSYLGGLPPLLVIASDGEVLRDEMVYIAHKAAHPDRYPVKPEAIQIYQQLKDIEKRFSPTLVHLQVYDQTAHELPVLFPFSTPAKYCFRSMASFVKHFAGMPPSLTQNPIGINSLKRRLGSFSSPNFVRHSSSSRIPRQSPTRVTLPRSQSTNSRLNGSFSVSPPSMHTSSDPSPPSGFSIGSIDSDSHKSTYQDNTAVIADDTTSPSVAGSPVVYQRPSIGSPSQPFADNMIRERISITGKLRELEPEDRLAACNLPIERIGVIGELLLRRYIEGRDIWNEKFASTYKSVHMQREKSLRKAQNESAHNIEQMQTHLFQDEPADVTHPPHETVAEGLHTAASRSWAWALDEECPPPSSIVARRDTREARRLARIADIPRSANEKRISMNHLWAFLADKLNLENVRAAPQEAAPIAATGGTTVSEHVHGGDQVNNIAKENEIETGAQAISILAHESINRSSKSHDNENSTAGAANEDKALESGDKHKRSHFTRLVRWPSSLSFRKQKQLQASSEGSSSHAPKDEEDAQRNLISASERGPIRAV